MMHGSSRGGSYGRPTAVSMASGTIAAPLDAARRATRAAAPHVSGRVENLGAHGARGDVLRLRLAPDPGGATRSSTGVAFR